MKKMLMVSNGGPRLARIVKAMSVLIIGLALGTAFWVASTPVAQAQDMSPTQMIDSMLHGKTSASATKAEYLTAVCEAVKKYRNSAPAITNAAVNAHPGWKKDILRTVFRCLGSGDCRLLGAVLQASISGPDASEMTDLAVQLAPGCAGSFGGDHKGGGPAVIDEGNFGNPPLLNINPPPGSIGGGGGQGNVIAICHNGMTIFVAPQGAEQHLRNHPGDTLGPCVVTPFQNP
jgi:hypothetical protein